jgi:hypothetical protein
MNWSETTRTIIFYAYVTKEVATEIMSQVCAQDSGLGHILI